MTNPKLLQARLLILGLLLASLELVNLVKLSVAMSWSNGAIWGSIAAIALGVFLLGSILALSFELDERERIRLQIMVIFLFIVQTSLICIVSYLKSLYWMPGQDIAMLFDTQPEATRKVIAVAEGVAQNVATFAFWGLMGSQWRKEIERQEAETEFERLTRLMGDLRGKEDIENAGKTMPANREGHSVCAQSNREEGDARI
jgi:hypothetical protein